MSRDFVHQIRDAELETMLPILPPGCRLLDLGAGDGWQARRLAQAGFRVTAVDVAEATTDGHQHSYHPVVRYDGSRLPFADDSFDVVFSSNVLEHMVDLPGSLREMRRVLSPTGVAAHCVPSATWRLWTTLGHPLQVLRLIFRMARFRATDPKVEPRRAASGKLRGKGAAELLRLALIPSRHGETGSALTELVLFSARRWARVLRQHGWQVEEYRSSGLAYSGNGLLGTRLGTRQRRLLSRLIGSSSHVFLVRPRKGAV